MSNEQLEQRLAAVEAEIAEIRRQLAGTVTTPKPNWLEEITGSMKDYPEFEDLLRYGREYREADRPEEHEE